MEPSRLFRITVLLSLLTVEYGGWGAAGVPHRARHAGRLPRAVLPAGHAHAGVLLMLSLAYFVYLGRAGYSAGVTIDARRLQPTVNN